MTFPKHASHATPWSRTGEMLSARKTAAAGVLIVLAVAAAHTQTLSVISSVKPSQGREPGTISNAMQGAVYHLDHGTLALMLSTAFVIPQNQILGGPGWMTSERWDVEAKFEGEGAPAPAPGANRRALVLRAVLRDRFKLDAAIEQLERPVYEVRFVRDGQFGPMMAPSELDCSGDVETRRKLTVKGKHGESPCAVANPAGAIRLGGMPLSFLIRLLDADRVIVDRTNFTTPVDLTVTWIATGDEITDRAAMYTALREQAGLRLVPATARIDMLVIKSVRRPTPN